MRRIFPIIDRAPLIDAGIDEDATEPPPGPPPGHHHGGGPLLAPPPASVSGAVSFVDVGFAYPGRPDVAVFRAFSLDIPAGGRGRPL